MRYLPLLVFMACDGKPADDDTSDDTDSNLEGDTDTDADTDADSDADSDADTDADTDTDTGADPVLTGIALTSVIPDPMTTRDVARFIVMAEYDDGSELDVTELASWTSSDEAVLRFYDPGVGQPLWSGAVNVTASYETFVGPEVAVAVTMATATAGDLVFNEVLSDGLVDGDPNQDGSLESEEDEFVEIANASDVTVDLSGVTFLEENFAYLPRHTFAEGTILRAGEAIVVFGGGDVSTLTGTNVTFVVAENEDPGLQYGLCMLDSGETIQLVGADGVAITTFTYGDATTPAINDASYVLDPEVWGTAWTHHYYAADSIGYYSPGTLVDGSAFPGADARYTN